MPVNTPEKLAQGFLFGLNTELGGNFMTAPFTDAMMPEVCARIVNRLVIQKYTRRRSEGLSGAQTLQAVLDDLAFARGSLLYSCALSAQFAIIRGKRFTDWYTTAITNSRAGLGFRRCWYDDYKGTRRDPRVTNRGVRAPKARQLGE